MNWKKLLAYATGSVDEELLLRNVSVLAPRRLGLDAAPKPVGSRNSCGPPVVELQQPTEPLTAANRPTYRLVLFSGKQQHVVLPLMVPFAVKVLNVGIQRSP
jgi:hypothetical protein